MITKEKHPIRILFLRDHGISDKVITQGHFSGGVDLI
jgi:hypothetical protein